MVWQEALQRLVDGTAGALSLSGRKLTVRDRPRLATAIDGLAHKAALASEPDAGLARWVIREAAAQIGVYPASIDGLYRARGRGASRNDFTVPAMNLRALSYHAARSVFRAARRRQAGALLFEIARSEMGYTNQRPAEYTSSIVAAAVAEGWQGPVFLQGDHFQISAKRFAETPLKEVDAVRDLIREAVQAGFFNIDIDTSTLVDLARPSIAEQQQLNYNLCAELALDVRRAEPKDVTISIGGEIGEVGGRNSTEAELRAFMDGFNHALGALGPGRPGLSKISIQTGTSHGGVVLPDGSIAQVSVDFDTLRELSRVARRVLPHGRRRPARRLYAARRGLQPFHRSRRLRGPPGDELPEHSLRQPAREPAADHVRLPGQELRRRAQAGRDRRAVLLQELARTPSARSSPICGAWERTRSSVSARPGKSSSTCSSNGSMSATPIARSRRTWPRRSSILRWTSTSAAAGVTEDVGDLAD